MDSKQSTSTSSPMKPTPSIKRGISGDDIIGFKGTRSDSLILGEYLAKGETLLLYAPTGQGKTVNALLLSVALSTGGTFFTWKAKKPMPVLFVEGGELTAKGIAGRMRDIYKSQGITSDPNFHLKAPTKSNPFVYNITDPSHQELLLRYVDEYGIECVVFDNYNSLRLEEDNEFLAWKRLEKFLNRLKVRGVASVVIHHTNKEGQKQSGVQRKVDYCDTVIRIQISRLSTKKKKEDLGKVYIEVEMEKFRWGSREPTTLWELVFTHEELKLLPVDYEEILLQTIKEDLNKYGISYVRKKFDFLGYKLDHRIRLCAVATNNREGNDDREIF